MLAAGLGHTGILGALGAASLFPCAVAALSVGAGALALFSSHAGFRVFAAMAACHCGFAVSGFLTAAALCMFAVRRLLAARTSGFGLRGGRFLHVGWSRGGLGCGLRPDCEGES